MAYSEVASVFDPLGTDFTGLLEHYKIYEPEEQVKFSRTFQFGYELLEEKWNTFRDLSLDVRCAPRVVDKFFVPLLGRESHEILVDSLLIGPNIAFEQALRDILAEEKDQNLFMRPKRFNLLEDLVLWSQAPHPGSFAEAVLDICSDYKGPSLMLLELAVSMLHNIDPQKNAVELRTPGDGHFHLDIARVSLNPKVQAARTLRAFRETYNLFSHFDGVIGTSWLLTPQFKRSLARMGFRENNGVIFEFYNPREIL